MLRHVGKKVLPHVSNNLRESFQELVEVFLVKEDLMLVERETSVLLLPAFALCDCEVVVVVALGGLDIEEIRPFNCP